MTDDSVIDFKMPDEVRALPKTNRANPSNLMPILLGVVFLSILVAIGLTFPVYEATLALGALIGLFLSCCVTEYPRGQILGQAGRLIKIAGVGAVLLCGVVAGTALFTQHKWTVLSHRHTLDCASFRSVSFSESKDAAQHHMRPTAHTLRVPRLLSRGHHRSGRGRSSSHPGRRVMLTLDVPCGCTRSTGQSPRLRYHHSMAETQP